MQAPFLKGKKLVFVPILRAGTGLLDGLLDFVPSARVGHLGLYRDPTTLAAIEYYCKLPEDIAKRLTIVVDPMLATGNSAIAAIDRLKRQGALGIRLLCLLAAPEGIARSQKPIPEVPIYTAAIDVGSTITAISCLVSATPVTACTAPNELPVIEHESPEVMNPPLPRDLVGYGRTPPKPRWPGEANIAVQFVINYEEGGENSNPAWRPGVGSLPIGNRRRRNPGRDSGT